MDREKLNDAADTAFLENYFPSATESPDPLWDMFADGFKQGTDWLMQQPLSERLTDEEKETIKGIYSEAQGWLDEKPDGYNHILKVVAVGLKDRLQSIFRADLFKEK